jgi:hypothetical protein
MPRVACKRRWLYQSTQAMVANSTSDRVLNGPVGNGPGHPLVVDLLVVPGRLGQEPLQPLDLAMLGAGDRLGAGQPGQGLLRSRGSSSPCR